MELSKYKLNRVKADVIETIGENLMEYLAAAESSLDFARTQLESKQATEGTYEWEIESAKQDVARQEITITIYQALIAELDKRLCK